MAASDFDTTGYGFETADLPGIEHGPLDLLKFFAFAERETPGHLEVEIGSGKGTFLVQHAPLYPGTDFLGIEYAKAYCRAAADRARRHAMGHVRLLNTEAAIFVRNYIADQTLDQVHIYFPDPWPKAKHNKRRIMQAPFMETLYDKLKDEASPTGDKDDAGNPVPGAGPGRVRLATDHEDYFAWMEEHAAKVEHLFERLPFEPAPSAGAGELVGTNFERKYREEGGRVFNGMILVKRPGVKG